MKAWFWPFAAFALILAAAAAVQAESAFIIDPGVNGPNPSGEAVVADDDTTYVARADGWITAIDRSTGDFAWETFAAARDPGSIVIDMVGDGDTLYAVLHSEGDGDSEPVVALRKSDGVIMWDSVQAFTSAGFEHFDDDVFRVAIDQKDPDAATALYLGLDHGKIAKIDKATGEPFLRLDEPMILEPLDQDVDSSVDANKHLSAILAIQVYDDNVFAYRRFGGILAENNQWAPYLFLGEDHVMYWLDSELQGPQNLTLPPFTNVEGNTSRPVYPGISDIQIRSDGDDLMAYFSGIGDPDSGLVVAVRASGPPAPDGLALEAYTAVTNEMDITYPVAGTALTTPDDEEQLLVWSMALADDALYAATWESQGLDLNPGNNGDTGYLFKLDLDTLLPVGGDDGWPTGSDTDGRRTYAGRILSLDVADGGDTVVAAHISETSPHPAIAGPDPSVPALPHVAGALIQEVPTDGRPMVNLLRPWGYEAYSHTAAVALRADHPGSDSRPTEVSLQYRASDCPAQVTSCWNPIPEVVVAFPGDGYLQTNNVDLDFPDGSYRVRVVVEDHLGRTYWDESDHDFIVDTTPPDIGAVTPADGAVLTTCQPLFDVLGDDATSGIDRGNSFLFIDVRETAYPYLNFTREAGQDPGFALDMSQLDADQDTPPGCLAEGAHLVHAEFVDRAGNFAFKEWTVHVDSLVKTPSFGHLDRQWFRDAQPTITTQFLESVAVDSATLNGVDVTTQIQVIDQHPTLNPKGTRVLFRPDAPLADGKEYTISYQVTDLSGNVGGPFESRFRIDSLAPTFSQQQPAPESILSDPSPTIAVEYEDPGLSGLVLADVEVFLDGFRVPKSPRTDGFEYVPATPLASGSHTVRVVASDVAGNHAELEWDFLVDLAAPGLDVSVELPPGQEAVKQGDTLRVVLQAADDSEIASATVDATGLDQGLGPAQPAQPVAGQPGRYTLELTVTDAGTKPVVVRAAVEDPGGSRTERAVQVMLDNEPPIAFMEDMPRTVGSSFELAWSNSPRDDLRGSGVAYYILERLAPDGEFEVIRDRVEGESIILTQPDAAARDLAFRVIAVDHAGNHQAEPSNVVVTTAVGDPFRQVIVPTRVTAGDALSMSATPLDAYLGGNVTVFVSLIHEGGTRYEFPLEAVGAVFASNINATALPPGGYSVRFHIVDGQGLETAGGIQTMTVRPVPLTGEATQAVAHKDSPGLILPATAAALLVAVALRRRR